MSVGMRRKRMRRQLFKNEVDREAKHEKRVKEAEKEVDAREVEVNRLERLVKDNEERVDRLGEIVETADQIEDAMKFFGLTKIGAGLWVAAKVVEASLERLEEAGKAATALSRMRLDQAKRDSSEAVRKLERLRNERGKRFIEIQIRRIRLELRQTPGKGEDRGGSRRARALRSRRTIA